MSENLPANIEQHLNIAAQLPTDPAVAFGSVSTSIDRTTPQGQNLCIKCLNRADFSGEECVGQVVEVEHYFAHTVTLVDHEDGEITEAVRVVLVGPAGERYGFVSLGILRSLGAVMHFRGMPPWRPPIRLRVIKQRTRRNFTTFLLEPAELQE